jgi:O-antigen ligase
MRLRISSLAAAPVLLAPVAIAFFSGGYFDEARLWAGVAAWLLVAVLAVWPGVSLDPGSPPARLALAGLAGLTVWTGLSILWAPVAGPAVDGLQRALLYLGALLAAVPLLRVARADRATEPALLAGCTLVAGYAVSERLVPGIGPFEVSLAAGERLNQPLTYWNALGAWCGIGLVLAAGVCADPRRPRGLRIAAAACAAPLGLALYLTFSRGALGAAALGLAALVALSPDLRTLRAALLAAVAAAVPALATSALPAVTDGGAAGGEGTAMLGVLAVTAAAAGLAAGRLGPGAPLPILRPLAIAAALAAVVAVFAAASVERSPAPEGATAGRFASAQSNRYAYWEVAVGAFGRHPLLGTGSGGFAVEWLRERTIDESVRDVHSLYLETATELGIAGLALLAVFLAGAGGVAARARGEAGAVAALVAYALHTGLDWDWEMPAVTLLAIVLIASLAVSGRSGSAAAAPPP